MIYLDNAATTLIKPAGVEHAVLNAMRTAASPGRGSHTPTMRAARLVYECREAAAELFSVDEPENIIFTFNATHALNIAINSLASKGTRALVSSYEHNSVTRPLAQLGADISIAEAPLFDKDTMLTSFKEKLPNAELAVCTHVSNAFGFILPIYEIADLCREFNVPLIIDASQSAGILDIDQKRLNAAFIAMPGHKSLFGPQGTGILIAAANGKPLMSGGSGSDSVSQQMPEYTPDRYEAGTHNVCGIAGLLAGIKYVKAKGLHEIFVHEAGLAELMAEQLSDAEDIEVFASNNGSQSGVVSIRSRKTDCERMAQELNRHDVCVRSGLHCAPFAHKSAGTLDTGTVRFSFSPFVTEKEIKQCTSLIKDLII